MTPSVKQGAAVRFGPFELDAAAGELRKRSVRVRLPYQPFQVLVALLERPGEIVTHQELIERLWPNGTVVEYEHSLATAVHKIREALEDSADDPKFIATVRKGYRFVAPVDGRLQPHAPWSPRPGATISHFRIVEKLGEGNMGVVYKARDNNLERMVALKFIAPRAMEDAEHKARFLREAKAAAQLDHPNICPIHEIDEVDGHSFFSMAYVSGKTVKDRIAFQPFTIKEALDVAIQTAGGLKAAHERGIVHRDIKSANLMLSRDGVVKIVDFGIAQLADGTALTKGQSQLGTPLYMSPEQVEGRQVDQRTDIWSLGVVLYEMITGKTPFAGDGQPGVGYAIVHKKPERLRVRRANVPGEVERIVEKALAKDTAKRYQQVDSILSDLRRLRAQLTGSVAPEMYDPSPRPKGWLSRIALAVPVLLLAAVAVWAIIRVPDGTLRVINPETDGSPSASGDLRPPPPSWPDARRVAMLRFETEGGEAEQALADGLLEIISRQMARLERFDRRLTVFPFRETLRRNVKTPQEAHREFGANLGISGVISLDATSLRLNLTLLDLLTNQDIDSIVLAGDTSELRAIESRSFHAIASLLRVGISEMQGAGVDGSFPVLPGVYELYLRGRGYLTSENNTLDNLNLAIQLLESALTKDDTYALAHAALCEARWVKSRYDDSQDWLALARSSCERALALDDQLSAVHEAAGQLATASGNHHQAIEAYRQALELDPDNDHILILLAVSLQGIGLFDQAEATLRRAIDNSRGSWLFYHQLGLFYWGRGRYTEAAEQFRQVTLLSPNSARGFLNLGGALYFAEDFDGARQALERSIDIEPQFRTLSNLGEIHYQEGRTQEAIRLYEQALKINDRHYVVWGNLGEAYAGLADGADKAKASYEKAVALARQALRANPKSPTALSHLALYKARLSEKAEALDLIERALDLPSRTTTDLLRAAKLHEALGDRRRAIEWFVKAVNGGYSLRLGEREPALRELVGDPTLRFQLEPVRTDY